MYPAGRQAGRSCWRVGENDDNDHDDHEEVSPKRRLNRFGVSPSLSSEKERERTRWDDAHLLASLIESRRQDPEPLNLRCRLIVDR